MILTPKLIRAQGKIGSQPESSPKWGVRCLKADSDRREGFGIGGVAEDFEFPIMLQAKDERATLNPAAAGFQSGSD
jgi:hypothetical protein